MIIPAGVDLVGDTEEEIAQKLVEVGYSLDAASYLAGKIKGSVVDSNKIV